MQDADRGRDHVVCDSFEQEHLHEMTASRADRARDPELTSPLGCEHDEDEEDKEDAGGDRERAERREDGHERRAGLIGRVQRILLRVVGLESELRERRLHALDHLSAQLRPALGPTGVRDEDRLYEPRLVQEALCLGEREKQAGAVRGPAVVTHDRLHVRGDEFRAGENAERVARVGPQLVCCVRVQEDLADLQVGQRNRLSIARDVAERT